MASDDWDPFADPANTANAEASAAPAKLDCPGPAHADADAEDEVLLLETASAAISATSLELNMRVEDEVRQRELCQKMSAPGYPIQPRAADAPLPQTLLEQGRRPPAETQRGGPPLHANSRRRLANRGPDGRRPLPEVALSQDEAVEWIMDAVDQFETLLLPPQAVDGSKVRQQYKQMLLLVHPDKNSNLDATTAFRKLFSAMECLCDPVQQEEALRGNETTQGGTGGFPENSWASTWEDVDVDSGAWWAFASVDEMERAFLEQERRMLQEGLFPAESLGKPSASLAGDCHLWVAPQLFVDSLAASEMLASGETIFLDARDHADFGVSHIPGALHMPGMTFNLPRALSTMPSFAAVVSNPDKKVIVYSDTGTRMSRCVTVAHALRNNDRVGPERVLRLNGGFNSWKRHALLVDGDRRCFFAGQVLGTSVPKLR